MSDLCDNHYDEIFNQHKYIMRKEYKKNKNTIWDDNNIQDQYDSEGCYLICNINDPDTFTIPKNNENLLDNILAFEIMDIQHENIGYSIKSMIYILFITTIKDDDKNCGCATFLLDFNEDVAKYMEIDMLSATVFKTNNIGKKLFRKIKYKNDEQYGSTKTDRLRYDKYCDENLIY